ncbi:hypothetical protein ABC347_09190 [Sphingomonas sp. 1P06PA]|uniref:SctD/MshK family protein n=1 Tax=Sphingomonas sp. 1P06PA TaxID=554121 RepID=UPI0039A62CC6
MSETGTSVIRVLNGRLAGTEKPLPASGRISIGHEYWSDVVLREPSTRGIAIELTRDPAGATTIALLSGQIGLLGSTLSQGQSAVLPPFVPLQIGGIAIAWGDPASSRWAEASGLATRVPPAALTEQPERLIDVPLDLIGKGAEAVRGWASRKRVAALAAGVLLVAAMPAAGPAVERLRFGGDGTQRLSRALNDAGLAPLAVSGDAGSEAGLVVTGVVARESDRLRAQQVMENEGMAGIVDVQTSGQLASAAADVARIHGIPASGRAVTRTSVELRTGPLSPELRTKLEQAVRADVSGLGRLVIRDDLPPEDDTPVRTVADVTKKVATVVAGDPAYIQAVDGTTYFLGAMMPSGHRLVSIQGADVLVEKNGRQTRISF